MQVVKCFVLALSGLALVFSAGCGPKKPPKFSDLDFDSDGAVTVDEFRRQKIPHGEHSKVFRAIDVNADGVIVEEELKNHKPPKSKRR